MKLLAGLITAVLTTAMLSIGFTTPAQARCDEYGPCIDTRMNTWAKKNPIRANRGAKFVVRIRATNGRSPDARLRIKVVRKSNGNVVWSGRRTYNERHETYRTGKLPRGRYHVIVKARTKSDRYQDTRGRFGLRVKRR